MKVIVENKKGLEKAIKVVVDKKTIAEKLDIKFEEIRKDVVLKGFRPGKVPTIILKRQFGKAVYGEVIDNVLKDTTTKALLENKIKPAGQPKIDLTTFGEGKDLEYTISVTELPKINLNEFQNIKFEEYVVKIDSKETEKRIEQIAKNQNNFKETNEDYISKLGDLIIFDYIATVDNKEFKGNLGKKTQLVLGKDLFIKGFDEQLVGVKNKESKKVQVRLPENYNEKELQNKDAIFDCTITSIKTPDEVKIDDQFAKNLGAKDLNNLKDLITKQINDEYKNSLELITKRKILDQIQNYKITELPNNLIEDEIKLLSQGMKEEDIKKNKKKLHDEATKRIKTGLFLSAFGQEKNVEVTEQEINKELTKQMGMMPGQEKIVQDYYQKNPAALNNLRGTIYEEKIIHEIKKNGKEIKKEISKEEAEKILKMENERNFKNQEKLSPHSHTHDKNVNEKDKKKNLSQKKSLDDKKKPKIVSKKKKKAKKVSKK